METSVSMKKLIAREMSSKEVEDREISSNVIAKLMGLETAPPRSRSRSSSHCSLENNEFKDDGSMSDRQIDLARRKFMEAKRVITDDKLHQSKEFQEALQVLSSNKYLCVKFLQESNSLFSDFNPVPPHSEATRITVLKPSKGVNAQDCRSKQIKKSEETATPTRIVVLKPSPGKALDIKAIASSSPHSYSDEDEDAETRLVAKKITRQIREMFRGHHHHQRNETLSSSSASASSVLSNGYIGDEGSNMGSISEIMSPSSRHSWDFPNRFDKSPFSSSSVSRVSFSPESSSLYREAKKRLSERWAMMALNGDKQQQRSFPKTSTALGEMLVLSEIPTRSRNEESNKAKQETRRSISCIGSGVDQVESANDSLNTLERSKSVPEVRLNGQTSVSRSSKAQEFTESRSLKPSWKVSTLFSFRNKKANKEKKADALSPLAMHSDALRQQRISPDKVEVTTPNENQDQPSPVSVLQPHFEEECVRNPECTTEGEETSMRSNLIDKSPPIGSIARVVSWEDDSSYTDITKPAMGIKEDEEWYNFIKKLLKASGFSGSDPLMARWHSPDSPMDPSLRDKFANKELIKRRKQRSNRKLVFDCVNAIITETTAAPTGLTGGFDMVEHVWRELKKWAVQDRDSLEGGESMVKDEAVGKTWDYNLQVEVNNLGIEIEVLLLQELVEEAVFDLT